MKKGKWFSLMLCILLAMSIMLNGCGGTKDDKKETGKPSSSKGEGDSGDGGYTLPLVDEPLTLTYMRDDTNIPGVSYGDGKALAINEAEKRTGIRIKWDLTPSGEYSEKLQLRMAAKQGLPDIIKLKGGQEGTYLSKALSDGIIIPLNDYIEKYGNNYKRIMEEYPIVREAVTLPDGSITSFHKIEPSRYAYAAQIIREDWLEKLELEMPTTLEEFLEVAIAFRDRDPNGNGENDEYGLHCANPSGSMFEYNQLGTAFGLHLCTGLGWTVRDEKVVYEWVTPEAKEFLKFLRKMVESGVLPPDYASVTYPEHDARVASGKVGLIPRGWPGDIIQWANPDSSMRMNQPDARWTVMPALKAESSSVELDDPIFVKEPTFRRTNAIVITTACKNPDIAYKFLDWAHYSEEGILLNNYGIEGETYTMKDGKPIRIPSEMNAGRPMPDGTWWGREYVELFQDELSAEASFELGKISLEDKIIKQIQGNWKYLKEPFYPPIPSVEEGNKLQKLLVDITTFREEMWAKFCNGSVSIDEGWDDYVKKIDQLKLQEVLKIYQKAYDRANK